ncbi:immunity protein 49 of polymorphic toxin system [Streptomyces sp. Ag109_G2-6]|uniref:immunity 49 family protein n=1 Tax=Streptomyces sp. Ag109_G2-6 TaxID=2485154 RepID=UPI000FBE5630|nr:immunity 49 family protein [Streptomyces sp. Ag109_G2-6]RPF29942.1 immunity protein 49 of polymorphic toxin system [Streptomyces sp. Ag109_G2-6]
MRIERHQVDEAAVSAALEDFENRIGGQVRTMSRGGPMATYEWQRLAEELLDHLGALSVGTPALDTPEAEAVLKDAAAAAAGAVAYAAYHTYESFHVFLDHVNFGMSYRPGGERDELDGVTPSEWIDAFCLTILADKVADNGEAFHFARQDWAENAPGNPATELVKGLMAEVVGDTGDEEVEPAPGVRAELAAIDAGLERMRARAADGEGALLDRPHAMGLRVLRALSAGDREAFDSGLAALLSAHSAQPGPGVRPRSLLPLLPLALAALAYRSHGWTPAADTDYLPLALVTGFATL